MSLVVWKMAPLPDERVAQLAGVDQVAVVADRELPVDAVDDDRLGVGQPALARRRVADVTDRQCPGSFASMSLSNASFDIAHRLRDADLRAVGRGNAGALLPAVLQRVEPEIREFAASG